MPYASSIQTINDANGTAYGFMEVDGLLWQCQWNPQAQRWDRGTIVPGAYGGEKLQALLVDDLWPSDSNSTNPPPVYAPGVVLAYTLGEGESAMVYATLGQWGSDGQLSWTEPMLLAESGSVVEAIALAASGKGGFALVRQTREATDSGATAAAPTTPRKDSELISQSFALSGDLSSGYSLADTTTTTVTINSANPTQPIGRAANSATSAAPALAVGGNTQISRSALQLASSASTNLQAADTQLPPSELLVSAAPTEGDTRSTWNGKTFFQPTSSSSSLKAKIGLVPGGVKTEWRLKEGETQRFDWYFLNKSSLKELSENKETATSQAAAARARWIANKDPEQNDSLSRNLYHWKKEQSKASHDLDKVKSLVKDLSPSNKNELVLKGSYGIDAYGQRSISNTIGLQYERAKVGKGDLAKAIQAFNTLKSLATLTQTKKVWTFAASLTTKYSYSNLIPSSDDFALKSVSDSASFSLGWDYKRSQRLETGGYVEFNAGASVGAVFKFKIIPTQKGSNMPSWLKWAGYAGGVIGVVRSEWTRQSKNYEGLRDINKQITFKQPSDPKVTKQSAFNTFAGVALTALPLLSTIGEDISFDNLNLGGQFKVSGGARWLYKGVGGFYFKLNDSITWYPTQKDAFSTGGWQNSLNVIGGLAFPLGVSIPLINLSWTVPNPSKPKSTNSSLSLLPSAGSSAGSDPDYSFSYAPAQGSTLLPLSSSNTGVPVAGSTAQLQLLGLIAYGAGAVMPAQATSSTPVVLTNAGAALVDGSYSGVPIMGVLLPGSTPATLSFTVVKGSIHAESLRIDDPGPGGGQYLQLPQTTSDSGIYALIPDVFSSGILPGPANAASSGLAQLLRQLPLISVNSSSISGTPLSIQSIAAIQPLVPVPAPTASSPSQIVPNPSPSDNSLQSYSDVPISLSGAHGISPLNQVTATVSLSNGVIVKVLLDQPLMFSYQGTPPPTPPTSLTLSLDLQAALGSDVANPSYKVTPQNLGLNNVVEDHSYQATRRYPANSGQGQPSSSPAQAVWLEDGINSEWQPTSAQAAWPVFNRVVVRATDGTLTYLNTSTTGSNGVVVQTTESPSDVTLQALYNDLTDPLRFGAIPNFSAASTPAVVSLAADATARFGGASAVFWVEASVPVIAQVSSDGSENYQAFMQALYGQQRINYRLFDPKAESWTAPRTLDLYEPDHALIRHLRAFNVQVDGTTRTLLVWDETSLDSIQETPPLPQPFTGWISGSTLYLSGGSSALRIGDLITGDGVEKGSLITAILTPFDPTTGQASYQISRNQSVGSSNAPAGLNATALLPPTVLKAGFINPNAQNLQWNSLFSDGYGNSTITTIPWDQANDIGIGIESLSVASHQSVDASGVVRDTAVLSWSENVRTPYVQSVLNDAPLIYLQFAYLQPGSNDINIGSTAAETTTGTYASSSGLNFTIASALPKSGASAVQNVDGTGALSTGTGSQNALTVLAFNSTPNSQLASTLLGQLTASISGTTLTVTALNGALEIGDLLTGPGLQPDTQITEVIQAFDPISGSGTYGINLNQNLSSTTLLALPNPAPRGSGELGLAYSSLIGTINGTTLSVSQLTGSLAVGDWIEGEGVSFGTTITAVQSFDPASGSGLYTLSQSQQSESLPASALIATPSSSVPYTIEFWARLPAGSNAEHGAGLVAFGQPSEQAVGPAVAPSGWLMSASFSVQPITYQDAAAQGFEDAYNKLSTNSATANDPYGWAWSLDATGANTTTLGGNGGSNLYSNALNLSNLYSGQTLTGVDAFLSAYGLKAADLVGVDGLLANTIALIPGTSMDFNNSLDPLSGLPVSNLNGVSIDTASSQLNSGLVQVLDTNGTLSSDATTNSHLQAMFQALWNYQQQYGEAKVGFTLDPAAAANPGSGFEQYGGYSLDFAISAGPAISVNNLGQLVFDVASDISLTSAATNPSGGRQSALPSDLRDGEWHHVVATYLPDYRSYTINGVVTQVPINQGTASLYVDNQLVASREGISDAFLATNINDTALLLAGNAGGAIDQFALYNKALLPAPPLPVNASGAWPAPSQQEVLAVLKQLGYPATADTPNPGAIQSAISEHWRSRDVNPNNALLATFSSTFSPSSSGSLSGSWSEAAPLNPSPAPVASTPSASAPSLQQDLLVAIKPGDWATNGNWFVGTNATSGTEFNPAGKQLKTITVTLTPSDGGASITHALSPGQVLMGGNSVASLQPRASTDNLNTTLLSATPALNLLIARKDDDPLDSANSGDLDLSKSYSASVTLTFADGPTVSNTSGSSQQTGLHLSVNNAGAGLISNINADATSNSTVTNRSKALATAAVIETAPLQLKYIDSGVVLNSASSQQAANSPATSSPAPTFGQSMAYGWFQSGSSTPYSGWLAIAQPSSANAISDPAGRAWIQYTGDFISSDPGNKPHTAVSDTAKAPSTWLNALANSNFSPEAANRPLLNDAMSPAVYGGLLIQADPTLGWGQNFAQTMLVADINGDGVLDLVISAPSANSGGKVVIIDGNWIKANLTNPGANTTLNLANPDNAGPHVLVLSPGQRQSKYEEDASQSAFGWALAFDAVSKTLYIGAPNYSREVGTDRESVPIGAVYQYESPSTTFPSGQQTLATPTVGIAGRTDTNDVGGPASSYWGAQLGASLAVSDTRQLAIGAPGVQASLLYSGTEAVNQLVAGKRNPSDPYGQGALVKVMLPTTNNDPDSREGVDVYVSSSDGTANTSLVDVISNNTSKKKSDLAQEESAYMQALKELQAKTIAKANAVNNSAIQTAAVGSVYLIDITNGTPPPAGTLKPSNAQATFYGSNPWNVGGATDFGASLAFGDTANSNAQNLLAIGAPSTGGPGAVYLINTSLPFDQPSTAPTWITETNLGNKQYLAYLTSGLTLYGAEDLDQFGAGLVNLGDSNSDGYDDLLIQAPNASSGAGNGYVVFGSDQLIATNTLNTGSNSSNGSLLGGHNPAVGSVQSGSIGQLIFADGTPGRKISILSELGHGVAAATGLGSFSSGDVDANGNNDILLGSGSNGQAYLTYGHSYLAAIDNLQLQKLAGDTGYLLDGLASTTQGSLRSIGDFNGDGYGDFFSIQPGTFLDTVRIELGANTQEILADYPYNYYSFQVASGTEVLPAGDINGDGYSDIALFLQQNLSSVADGNAGAGSTTGILYGRPSDQLPLGSGFGLLAPVDASSSPLAPLPTGPISGALSTQAPAMLAMGSTIYSVWCDALAGSPNLWFAQSRDGGTSWSSSTNLSAALPALASGSTPSLTLFNDKLYLGFRNGSGQLSLSSWDPTSGDPTLWSNPTLLSNGGTTPKSLLSPSLIPNGDALSVVWVDDTTRELQGSTTTTPDLYSSSGSLGTASSWKAVSDGASPSTPALANEGNTVYMAMRGENSQLYWNSSSDGGQTWRGWQELPSGMTSNDAPSLAIVNGSLYLTYLGPGNQELHITQLTNAATNTWSTQTLVSNQSARNGLGAVAISETVNGSEGLAIYYVANNSTGTILRTWSSTPLNAGSWYGSQQLGVTSTNTNGFTSSSPLAVAQFQGNTVLAYMGDAATTNTTAYIATAGNTPSITGNWTTISTLNTGNQYGIGLSSDATGLLLNTTDTGTGQQAIYRLSPPAVSGSWSQTFYTSRASISSSSPTAALLSLPSNGNTPQLLLAAADQANAGAIDVSAFYPEALNSSWSSATPLRERLVATDGSVSFQPITASAAPSATLINGSPVLSVNNNGTLNLYTGNGGKTFSLASSFSLFGGFGSDTTPAGLTTTDTGLALSYLNAPYSVSLQRLNFLQLDGTPVDGVVFNADSSIDTSNANLQWQGLNLGLGTNLATVPLSVNGTLLLGSTSDNSNQVQLSAIPVLSNPGSTTWLNSTVQLPDGQGGWTLQQKAGANGAINLGPVLPDWQPIDSFNTPDAPAFVELAGVLYAITRGEDKKLYINSSSDAGITWSGWSINPTTTDLDGGKPVTTTQPPTIASFGGQLYVCYIRRSDSNLMLTRYEPGTKGWGGAINIDSQKAKYLAAVNQEDNLFTLYYVGTDDKLYYTSTTDPGNNGSFTGSAAINNSSGNFHQTSSGPLAAARLNGATYLAYQGGTSESPSNTIYITTGPVANNNSQNWGTFEPLGPQTSSTSKSIGLSANNLGLVLSTTDTINGQQVISLQQGTGSGTNWSFTPFTTLQQEQGGTVSKTSASLVGSPGTEAVLVASTAGSNTSGGNALISTQATYQPSSLTLNSQQTGSSLSSVGDLDGDGYDDLVVVANNVVVQPDAATQQLATGLRLIRGAATSGNVLSINSNESTSSSQSVQIASSFGLNGTTPVLSLSGSPSQLALTSTSTTDGQPSELRAALLSPSLFEASSGDLNTARQLFSGSPTSGSPGLGLGFGDLRLNTTANFGDLNADGYLDTLDGMPTTVYGANGLGWQVWSIRAAGDVNGNGADDVLLSLVPPEAVLNGAPQWIQPVLLDGALFKVDTETNSFSFSAMRAPLDPYGRLQLQDLDATSSAQPWPLLQNWITPILSFQPASGSSSATIATSSPASTSLPGLTGGAAQQATVATAYGSSGEILLISGSMTANGFDQTGFPIIQISRVSADGTSTQWTAGIPGGVLSKANTGTSSDQHYFQLSPSGAAIFDGYLYLALSSAPYLVSVSGEILTEDDGEMFLFSIKESDLTPDGVADASKWNQYQLPGKTSLQPALVNEEGQLALYFVSDNQKKNILVSRSSDPQNSASWDGSGTTLPWTNPNETEGQIQINSGLASPLTRNIAATRFHALTPTGNLVNRTYLAFCMNTKGGSGDDQMFIVEQPAETGGTWTASQAFNAQPGIIYLSANSSQLALVTTNLTGSHNPFGVTLYNAIDATPASATLQAGANATVVGASTIGGQLILQTQSTQFFGSSIALQPVATPWATASQQSLAGYSIDGNIDVNGDGFMDMLVSDPSDPSQNVDNQYVLFGGDYLNIASKVGTTGDDVMLGTPLADVIYTLQGADQVISHGGKDVIYTAAGDDSISIRDNAFIRIDAGAGFDVLKLKGLANQSYDFRLNVSSPEYFAGTKLRDIELISSLDSGANTLSFDAAAVNAINPDRVLFLTPDESDSITLSTEFNRNASFDTSFGGTLWSAYAAAPASATPASGNPALVYVAVPTGQTFGWLSTNVSLTDTPAAAPASALRAAAAPAGTAASDPPSFLPTSSPIADTQVFGDGLTLLAYRTGSSTGMARFAIERSDPSKRQVVLYASSSANGSAEPGSHYTAVAGLLVFEPGQTSHEVTVPIDSVAFARLASGSLSLQVKELQEQRQSSLHLLITPTATTAAAAQPVLSGFELSAAENGTSAILSFRADSTSGNPDSLQLTVSQRDRADSVGSLNSQNLQILDFGTPTAHPISSLGVPLDHDGRKNDQVSTSLKLNFAPKNGEASVSLLGPAPVLEQTVQQVGTDQIRFQHNGPLTSWRSDSGSGSVTFGLQAGTTSETLLTAASGGSVGSIDPARALDNSPQAGWQGSEGLAVGSRSITTVANLSAQAWTPSATRNGVALNLQDISINGNQVTARFQGGVSVEFWQASGTDPSLVPIAPAVEVKRLAGYNNTIGFYSVDSITGLVDGRSPGEAGYLQAALARSEAEKLLLSAAELPAFGQSATFNALPLNTQQRYGVLLLQNGARNTLFSSFSAANPGGETQMVRLGSDPSSYVLGIEDIAVASGRSDRDFNDNILTISGVSLGLF